jgi:hypothetical protein
MSASLSLAATSGAPGSLASVAPEDGGVTLRVSGGKPLHLCAELVAEGTSWTAGAPAWHEVALYQRVAGGAGTAAAGEWAVALRVCRSTTGAGDLFHARLFPALDDALAWLQEFDPTAGLAADIDASDRRVSTTDIALRAAALRQRADRVDLQYRAMIGELLYRLDLGE